MKIAKDRNASERIESRKTGSPQICISGFVASGPEYAEIRRLAIERGATYARAMLDASTGEIEIEYRVPAPKFDRIRRITGYLVGTLGRFNDAKKSEESERVKHGV